MIDNKETELNNLINIITNTLKSNELSTLIKSEKSISFYIRHEIKHISKIEEYNIHELDKLPNFIVLGQFYNTGIIPPGNYLTYEPSNKAFRVFSVGLSNVNNSINIIMDSDKGSMEDYVKSISLLLGSELSSISVFLYTKYNIQVQNEN